MEDLKELLIEQLRDLYNAEGQLVKALPKMAKAANSEALRQAFEDHLEQTRGHVTRLERVFELLGSKAKGKACKAMQGLVEEGGETITEGKEMEEYLADLALIVAAQKVEHYEISGYGSLRTIAERIGETEVARLLQQNQSEELAADKKLTTLSQPLLQQAA